MHLFILDITSSHLWKIVCEVVKSFNYYSFFFLIIKNYVVSLRVVNNWDSDPNP